MFIFNLLVWYNILSQKEISLPELVLVCLVLLLQSLFPQLKTTQFRSTMFSALRHANYLKQFRTQLRPLCTKTTLPSSSTVYTSISTVLLAVGFASTCCDTSSAFSTPAATTPSSPSTLPATDEDVDEEKNTLYEPKDDFFQFGSRRNTPMRHKDRNYEPQVQKTCSSASVHASRGPRSYMEDEHYVSDEGNFFAVFDGHGGSGVAEHLNQHIWPVLSDLLDKQGHFIGTQGTFGGKDLRRAFTETCTALQVMIARISKFDHVGSTATMVALDNNSIWSINVGDSRAVLCRSGKAVDLSVDHKPNDPNEMERIINLGGRVKWYGWEDEDGRPVPSMGAWRINGNLACSRSFGDRLEAPYVTAEPDVRERPRNWMEDQFIILASDGLWDVFESQEAVDFVNNAWLGMNAQGQEEHVFDDKQRRSTDRRKIRQSIQRRQARMGRYLVEEALRRGTMDNTTAVVVWLR
jgi:serine/threonine protein phosphatase PrpC